VAAFQTPQRGFLEDDPPGLMNRVFVVTDDGGVVLVRRGYVPTLSDDGRRLAYATESLHCEVLDLDGGVVWRSEAFGPFVPRLSGDGRALVLGPNWIALP
jgi:hypothetical protein